MPSVSYEFNTVFVLMKIKVILIDDHPLVREGVSNMLGQDEQLEIVASYATTSELLNGLKSQQADVILLDLQLVEGNSDFVIQVIKTSYPHIRILILSSNDNIYNIKMLLNNGADGYLLKNTGEKHLRQFIKRVWSGKEQPVVSPEVHNLLQSFSNKRNIQSIGAQYLTPREVEVLQLISQELTSHEIGKRLHLSQRTVESYRLLLMQKLQVKNMVGMVKKAIMLGLVNN